MTLSPKGHTELTLIVCIFTFLVANVLIGLYLFGDKIANPEDMNAYWVMVALVATFVIVDGSLSLYFGLSRRYCVERTEAKEDEKPEMELKEINSSSNSVNSLPPQPPRKKIPSPVSHFIF